MPLNSDIVVCKLSPSTNRPRILYKVAQIWSVGIELQCAQIFLFVTLLIKQILDTHGSTTRALCKINHYLISRRLPYCNHSPSKKACVFFYVKHAWQNIRKRFFTTYSIKRMLERNIVCTYSQILMHKTRSYGLCIFSLNYELLRSI